MSVRRNWRGKLIKLTSLFAGIGGFDLAFEKVGAKTVMQCEIDKFAQSILAYHWPDVPKHGDVSTLKGADCIADVVTFGSPCQDLSVAGKRAGLGGERSGLFLEAIRIIQEMQEATDGQCPRFAIWENVPGAYSSNEGRDFATVLSSLVGGEVYQSSSGWTNAGVCFGPKGQAAWRTLDTQHHGIPQRRRRIFVVTDFRGERAGEILFERSRLQGNTQTRRKAGEGVAKCLTSGTEKRYNPETETLIPMAFKYNTGATQGMSVSSVVPTLDVGGKFSVSYSIAGNVIGRKPENGGNGMGWSESVPHSLTTADKHAVAFAQNSRDEFRLINGDGQSVGALAAQPGIKQQSYVAETQTPYKVRRLTPTECERLQSFPDGWTRYGVSEGEKVEISDTQRYKMLGNAVTVEVVRRIAERMVKVWSSSE